MKKKIEKEILFREMDKRSNARIVFSESVKALAYDHGKIKRTVLQKDEVFWLGANHIDFKSPFLSRFVFNIPKSWRKTILIPLHNNEYGLSSVNTKPGLFYCKLEEVLEYGFFTKIPKMFKFPEIKEAVEKIEPIIIEEMSKKLKPVMNGNKINTDEYFKSFEDTYYMIFEDMLKKHSKKDLQSHLDMSDNTFNQVQVLALSLLEKCLLKNGISKKIMKRIIQDSGCFMFKMKDKESV